MINIYRIGAGLLILSGIIVFGADKAFKKGRIQTSKNYIIVKLFGLLITAISVLIMIYGS